MTMASRPQGMRALADVLGPMLLAYFRAEVHGWDKLPEGPALLVANHGGGMSPGDGVFLLAHA